MKPYQDKLTGNVKIREFNLDISNNELVWHRDERDRYVTILEGKGWFFQKDNELPLELKENDIIFIPKLTYHRVIKGSTPLKIKIQE